MKYIRTKDGKIYNKSKIICSAFREEYCSPNWNEDIEKYLQTKIVAEADTIEELCDEFVSVYKNLTPELLEPKFVAPREPLIVSWRNRLADEHLFKDNVVYGAIWTDKGLIYVAKMNDKGELELL